MKKFEAYEIALEVIRELREVLPLIKRVDRDLEKQARRAATSVALNLSEGNMRLGRDRLHPFAIAGGSASEVRAVLDVCEAFGYVPGSRLKALRELVESEVALTWRLSHPC